MAEHKGLLIKSFSTQAVFDRWISKNVDREEGLWVKLAKKGNPRASITYVGAREVALIYGWIDGLKNRIDDDDFAIRFTPRRARSKWSKINREIVEGLIANKRMHPSGLAVVAAAKADGRWDAAYAGPATAAPHPELLAALRTSKKAGKVFKSLSSANRFAIVYAVQDAKRDATRARRIAKYIEMLECGEVPHPGR